jgi:hypothetical protein
MEGDAGTKLSIKKLIRMSLKNLKLIKIMN